MGLGKKALKGVALVFGFAFSLVDGLATAVFNNAAEVKANSESYKNRSNQELKEIFESDRTSMNEKAGAVRQMKSRNNNS